MAAPQLYQRTVQFAESDAELLKLLMVKITQVELIRDRGYEVDGDARYLSSPGLTVSEFRNALIEKQLFNWQMNPNTPSAAPRWLLADTYFRFIQLPAGRQKRAIMVYYTAVSSSSKSGTIDTDTIKEFMGLVENFKKQLLAGRIVLEQVLLVSPAPLGAAARDRLTEFTTVAVTVFLDSELSYPIMHVDTPQHILLTPKEVRELKDQLKITSKDFMIMTKDDPVAKYYGWPAGSVIRIVRNDDEVNLIVDTSENYRIIL
jgi:DNA-directed RNA polymerase subunit H (RpoH/RPB5)